MKILKILYREESRTFFATVGDASIYDLDTYRVVEEVTDLNQIDLASLGNLIDADLENQNHHSLCGLGEALALDLAGTVGVIKAKRILFDIITGKARTSKYLGY